MAYLLLLDYLLNFLPKFDSLNSTALTITAIVELDSTPYQLYYYCLQGRAGSIHSLLASFSVDHFHYTFLIYYFTACNFVIEKMDFTATMMLTSVVKGV